MATRLLVKAGRADDVFARTVIPNDPDLRRTAFKLDGREHLKAVNVAGTDVSAYDGLLATAEGRVPTGVRPVLKDVGGAG